MHDEVHQIPRRGGGWERRGQLHRRCVGLSPPRSINLSINMRKLIATPPKSIRKSEWRSAEGAHAQYAWVGESESCPKFFCHLAVIDFASLTNTCWVIWAGDLCDFSESRAYAYVFYIYDMILPHDCIFMCCCFSGILWRAGIGETENDRLSVSMW